MLNLVPRQKSDVVLADLATSKIAHAWSRPMESSDWKGAHVWSIITGHARLAGRRPVCTRYNPGNDRVGGMRDTLRKNRLAEADPKEQGRKS